MVKSRRLFQETFDSIKKISPLANKVALGIYYTVFYLLNFPFFLLVQLDLFQQNLNSYFSKKMGQKTKLGLAIFFTLAAMTLITLTFFIPALWPIALGLGIFWLFGGSFDVFMTRALNKICKKFIRLTTFELVNIFLNYGALHALVLGIKKLTSLISYVVTLLITPIVMPIAAIAKAIIKRPVLRYCLVGLLLALAVAIPFLAPITIPALALGITAVSLKIGLGLSYASLFLPLLIPDKIMEICKNHNPLTVGLVVLLIGISIALPFVGGFIGLGAAAVFGAALLGKTTAALFFGAASLVLGLFGLKLKSCCSTNDHSPSNNTYTHDLIYSNEDDAFQSEETQFLIKNEDDIVFQNDNDSQLIESSKGDDEYNYNKHETLDDTIIDEEYDVNDSLKIYQS